MGTFETYKKITPRHALRVRGVILRFYPYFLMIAA